MIIRFHLRVSAAINRKLLQFPGSKLLSSVVASLIQIAIVITVSFVIAVLLVSCFSGIRSIVISQKGNEIYSTKDIIQEWLLATAILNNANPYVPIQDLARQYLGNVPHVQNGEHPTPHPPTAGLIFLPLAFLSYPIAVRIWLAIEIACLWGALYLICLTLECTRPWRRALAVTPLALSWGAVTDDLALGQLVIFQLFVLSAAWLSLAKGCDGVAGLLVGFSVLLKPTLWPVALLFLTHRSRRGMISCASIVAAGYFISAFVLGIERLNGYFTSVVPIVDRVYSTSLWNLSLRTVGPKLFQGTYSSVHNAISAPPLINAPALASPVGFLLPLALLAATVVAVRRMSILASFAMLMTISIIISPVAWGPYVALLALPIAWIFHSLYSRGLPHGETIIAVIQTLILFPRWTLWVGIALSFAGLKTSPEHSIVIPADAALITLIPTVTVLALLVLILHLDLREKSFSRRGQIV